MTTRYQSEHYEDVARLLSTVSVQHNSRLKAKGGMEVVVQLISDFAGLFAADNPPDDYCGYCGVQPPFHVPCLENTEHSIYHHKGFYRADFLSACGLESEG